MAPRPESQRPVDVHGSLRVDTPSGRSLDLAADGHHLRVKLSGRQDARDLFRAFPGRRRALGSLSEMFATHGLTLTLESAGRPVFRLGNSARPNWLARLLGLAPAQIPLSAIGLLFRR
jgi:hypothetical protein